MEPGHGERISLDFETIEKGDSSHYDHYKPLGEPRLFKIESQEELENFWTKHTDGRRPTPKVPEIDFEKEVVVAVIDVTEPSGYYSIEIECLEESEKYVIVKVIKISPNHHNCITTGALTQPYHIIKTARNSKPFLRSQTDLINDECIPDL